MYQVFAAYYDRLTGEIDYTARAAYFDGLIRSYMQVNRETILLDLACGTGSLTAAMGALGYDVIGVDSSPDMLSEAMAKNAGSRVQLICQDAASLDLFGTIDVAVCALDSLNHIVSPAALRKTFERLSLFTVPGGLFLFDVNTPYKHREVLGNNTFVYDLDDLYCVWQNATDQELCTEITLDFFIRERGGHYRRESECFCERAWEHDFLCSLLEACGYILLACYAGDTQEPVGPMAQRAVYVAKKREK